MEEEETGHKYNSTNTMWIYDKDIKIELIRTSETFKPGLKYTAFVSCLFIPNSLVLKTNSMFKIYRIKNNIY